MKNIIFVWIPIAIFGVLVALAGYTTATLPFEGAIFLLGSSIVGYTGVKSLGVYTNAKDLPHGQGVDKTTKQKLTQILIALYVLILEAFLVQYFNDAIKLPFNELLTMAGACTGVILAGSQAIKAGEEYNGK